MFNPTFEHYGHTFQFIPSSIEGDNSMAVRVTAPDGMPYLDMYVNDVDYCTYVESIDELQDLILRVESAVF